MTLVVISITVHDPPELPELDGLEDRLVKFVGSEFGIHMENCERGHAMAGIESMAPQVYVAVRS